MGEPVWGPEWKGVLWEVCVSGHWGWAAGTISSGLGGQHWSDAGGTEAGKLQRVGRLC